MGSRILEAGIKEQKLKIGNKRRKEDLGSEVGQCESGKRVSNSVYRKKILDPSVNHNLMIIEIPVRFITLFTKANCYLNAATYQDINMKLSNN